MQSVGFGFDTAVTPLSNILGLVAQRQQITGHNIANVHTPGYVTQDVAFGEALSRTVSPFETQLSKKMTSGMAQSEVFSTGEPVNLHHQFLQMSENMLYYNMATRRLTTILSGLRTASQIGR